MKERKKNDIGFLHVLKAIVLEMLTVFTSVEQQQPTGGTFYTKDEETR